MPGSTQRREETSVSAVVRHPVTDLHDPTAYTLYAPSCSREGLVEEREMTVDCRIQTTLRALVLPRWRPFQRTVDNLNLRMKETQPEGDIAQEDTVTILKSHMELLQWTQLGVVAVMLTDRVPVAPCGADRGDIAVGGTDNDWPATGVRVRRMQFRQFSDISLAAKEILGRALERLLRVEVWTRQLRRQNK